MLRIDDRRCIQRSRDDGILDLRRFKKEIRNFYQALPQITAEPLITENGLDEKSTRDSKKAKQQEPVLELFDP
nr:hypothetical protein [Candidatus Sigynarchaeota archaeon]